MARTLIAGGTVVSGDGPIRADVLVDGEKIRQVGTGLPTDVDRVLDATGLLVLPGAIDVHVHPVYLDDLAASAAAAAYGGTTTLIHFAYAKPGHGLLETVCRFAFPPSHPAAAHRHRSRIACISPPCCAIVLTFLPERQSDQFTRG